MEAIAVPLVSLLPWAGAWWLHREWLFAEAREAEDPARMATAERLNAAVVALIGLAALAGGLAGLLGLLLDALLGGNRTLGDFWKGELAGYLAAAAIGIVFWLWNWLSLQARRGAAPREEADSTVRRAYLLIVVGTTVIASLGSLAFVLYRLFASILNVDIVQNAASALSAPLGALIVAAGVAVYHGLALRRDQALRADAASAEPTEPAAGEAAADIVTAPVARTAAAGADRALEHRPGRDSGSHPGGAAARAEPGEQPARGLSGRIGQSGSGRPSSSGMPSRLS